MSQLDTYLVPGIVPGTYFTEIEIASGGKILTQPLTLEHCTALAVGQRPPRKLSTAKLTGVVIPRHGVWFLFRRRE